MKPLSKPNRAMTLPVLLEHRMSFEGTLLLRRSDVEQLLSLRECIDAVEKVFRLQGEGKILPPGILGIKAKGGGFHVKAGLLSGEKDFLVAKLNTNFPGNPTRAGLPTIQGVIVICDANNGCPLALLDSIDITIKRTAAATAVAARHLARKNSTVATICGCGAQGFAQLRAIQLVRPLKKVYAFDLDEGAAKIFADELSHDLKVDIKPVKEVSSAIRKSDLIVTCTPSREFFISKQDISPGTFIAAVGADDSHKQEIDPALMASAKVVADSLDQACSIGDTHHAIAKHLMSKTDVHAELSEIVAGQKPGRTSDAEIIIFDSTGIAIEDAIAAAAVYEKARTSGVGTYFKFAA
ncbi:MAG TPA: ornithine cyclodeaminase family protein [Chthoniobacterales bacterium]|nr:ornithine cyclodeaminase family protein [Chthoniobacterales bacterium]